MQRVGTQFREVRGKFAGHEQRHEGASQCNGDQGAEFIGDRLYAGGHAGAMKRSGIDDGGGGHGHGQARA